ncbi:thymidylate synthase [Oscillochloris sp. ZM17-4]|uniref:thymidylate synthase n=1 Tax=Oscillochloris sp. ZM17-4 TaxID=2866714 RepID=UPI001C72B39C|nr:thymidylate synthase [Oscillochloris sp. ZM17-4]
MGVCLLWTPQERVLPALDPADYAVAGNLYSRDGVSFLLRTVLARPSIRAILLCGKDATGSGAALVALMRDGLDAEGRIVGDGTRLHPEISREAVELFRRSVALHDARDAVRPEQIAALLRELRRPAEPFAPAPITFPYSEPAAAALPAAATGLLVRAGTVRQAYLRLIWHVLSFGVRGGTQHSSDQREILDVLTVVGDEPAGPAAFSHADWMPFTRESLGGRGADGGYSGYLGQFLEGGMPEGVSYTYGSRLRSFAGAIDQVAAIVADLRASGESRRAVAALWSPAQDIGSPSPPCLNLVQARLRAGPGDATPRLFLTAYFRSHDIFRAWASNAYGLRALQALIAERLGDLPLGDLAILSHSAHIYAHDWERAGELLAHHYRAADPRLARDARGSFVIAIEPPAILVRHYTPSGEHLQTFRGESARELGRQITPYVGEASHAIYLGQELQKAELAIALGRPEAYRQDLPLALDRPDFV